MASKQTVEKCLRPIWKGIVYLAREKRFATVGVRFNSEEAARQYSTATLTTAQLVLQPTYLGWHTSKITVREIPPEVDLARLVAAIILGLEKKSPSFKSPNLISRAGSGEGECWA